MGVDVCMATIKKPSYLSFNRKNYPWKPGIDYRAEPEKYQVGKGEQGVLICQPYKNEINPFWRFKDRQAATISSEKIFTLFLDYLKNDDFVGADLARKFLQMGYTRARRYANYKGGNKYDKENDYALKERGTGDPEKAACASIFYAKWQQAEANATYAEQKKAWKIKYG